MPAEQRIADIVQAGEIRLALFLPQYAKDPTTGELRGLGPGVVMLEIGRALAARLGVSSASSSNRRRGRRWTASRPAAANSLS